ncbi:hypothetical protein AB1Y20_011016 [Prymnesium parvum]|uniref:Major facilitator superfamily (MFS) profile domain-containing protein n=1 Tax=Prymnesium parvum TaxID=97485 RepID=A0AB34IP85_PRYPA
MASSSSAAAASSSSSSAAPASSSSSSAAASSSSAPFPLPAAPSLALESTPLLPSSDGYTDAGFHLCGCGPRLRDRALAAFLTLFLVWLLNVAKEASNDALPSTMPYFEAYDTQAELSFYEKLPLYGDFFYAAGKGAQIVANHFAGARLTILSATTLAAVGLFGCATGPISAAPPKTIGWGTAQLGTGMLWSSSGRIFANWVDFSGRGRLLAVVFGIGTDGGGGLTTLLYSFVAPFSWRAPFLIGGGLFLVVAGLCAGLLRGSAREAGFRAPHEAASLATGAGPDPLKHATLLKALSVFLLSIRCLLTIAACTAYATAWGAVLSYLPDYAVDQLGASKGAGTRLVSWGSFGAAFGSVISGVVCDFLPGNGVLIFTVFVKLLGVGGGIALVWIDGFADKGHGSYTWAVGTCVVLLAISIFYSWTVIINLFALRYGGPSHCATLQGLQDFLSYLIRIPLLLWVADWADNKQYRAMLWFVLAMAIVGHVCILIFLVIDQTMPPKPRAIDAPAESSDARPDPPDDKPKEEPRNEAYSDAAIRVTVAGFTQSEATEDPG